MKHIVGVADMKVSSHPDDVLITYALGSCLGIAIHDPVARVGGLLHVMLPLSTIDPAKAKENPYMFVDTGVPRLFIECYKAGAKKERLVVKVAGGASLQGHGEEDHFQIGKRNFLMLRKLFWKNGVLINAHDVGGQDSRTMSLHIGSGEVLLRANGQERRL
ncbi:MAG: chemotaxis protein CheD [Abditibacteriales bacterium]|nr:chemotaxis protein CheD [Abditibacteriales bacterium]MDW8366752.1 chemotaxis protein CheD [Abditibacteriales bacterium]